MDRPSSRRNRSALGGGGSQSARPPGRGRRRAPRSSSTNTSLSTTSTNNNSISTIPVSRPRSSRPKNRHRRRPPPSSPPQPQVVLKVIVRRLPPTLTANDFAKEANPRGADRAVWRAYSPGSLASIGTLKRTTHVVRHSVAYLAFSDIQHAIEFQKQFTGFKFVETNPNSTPSQTPALIGSSNQTSNPTITTASRPRSVTEYVAKVERALWQATPPPTRKKNPIINLQGTIESDPDYIAFCKKLQAESRGEDIRKSSPSANQSSELLPTTTKQSITEVVPDKQSPITVDDNLSAKTPSIASVANPNGKSNLVTPLMEDVRAKRKERDLKKKPPKSTPRALRSKGRQSSIMESQKPPAETPSKNSLRKKKRRGNDSSNGEKRNDDINQQDGHPRTPKSILGDRRDAPTPFRDDSSVQPESTAAGTQANLFANANTNSVQNPNTSSSRANGRNGSNRSRYGRSPRGRGKFSPNRNALTTPRNEFPPSSSPTHTSVRLLKKEASATSKT